MALDKFPCWLKRPIIHNGAADRILATLRHCSIGRERKILLGPEVVVERHPRDVGLADDLVDADSGQAALLKQARCGGGQSFGS